MVKSGQYGYRRPTHTEMVCWINWVERRGAHHETWINKDGDWLLETLDLNGTYIKLGRLARFLLLFAVFLRLLTLVWPRLHLWTSRRFGTPRICTIILQVLYFWYYTSDEQGFVNYQIQRHPSKSIIWRLEDASWKSYLQATPSIC